MTGPAIINERYQIRQNYEKVLERIAKAAHSVGRDPKSIQLVVVTKGQPVERIIALLESGARDLGENYAEEAVQKMNLLQGFSDIKWHMIGHVQSRKARVVWERFDWVHSLDSIKLAEKFDRIGSEIDRKLPILLECNVSGESTKFGWPAWDERDWERLYQEFSQLQNMDHLLVRGLMTMPPLFDDPEMARPYFRCLRNLQEFLRDRLPKMEWCELSMGMSSDFEIAIQEGATIVRIGTAIMGPRNE